MRQVHIVAKQRLAGSGMSAGDDPVIRSRCARLTAIASGSVQGMADGFCRKLLIFRLIWSGESRRAIIGCAGRRPVMPGPHRIQVGSQFRGEVGADLFPPILRLKLRIEQLAHADANQHRIGNRPRTRRVTEDAKLHRQMLAALLHVGVDPFCVRLKETPLAWRKLLRHPLRYSPQLQNALALVIVNPGFAWQCRAGCSGKIYRWGTRNRKNL